MRRLACLALLVAIAAYAYDHNWQVGKVVDTAHDHFETKKNARRNENTYTIRFGNMIYSAEEDQKHSWSKPAHLTVNGEVRFYIEKHKIHFIDEDGKEHEADIVKEVKAEP